MSFKPPAIGTPANISGAFPGLTDAQAREAKIAAEVEKFRRERLQSENQPAKIKLGL